jgi:hypothetical protein
MCQKHFPCFHNTVYILLPSVTGLKCLIIFCFLSDTFTPAIVFIIKPTFEQIASWTLLLGGPTRILCTPSRCTYYTARAREGDPQEAFFVLFRVMKFTIKTLHLEGD